jgi:hypothetical protein
MRRLLWDLGCVGLGVAATASIACNFQSNGVDAAESALVFGKGCQRVNNDEEPALYCSTNCGKANHPKPYDTDLPGNKYVRSKKCKDVTSCTGAPASDGSCSSSIEIGL